MRQWEYMQLEVSNIMYFDELDIERLNHYGNSGWELVTIMGNYAIFKREKER